MKFTSIVAALFASVAANNSGLFSHANLLMAPGQYEKLSDEFRTWFESE